LEFFKSSWMEESSSRMSGDFEDIFNVTYTFHIGLVTYATGQIKRGIVLNITIRLPGKYSQLFTLQPTKETTRVHNTTEYETESERYCAFFGRAA
jgi:hypothetical protein